MLAGLKTLKDFDFKNKVVLVRADLNVPVNEKGEILNDFRIKSSLPTIRELFRKGASQVILMSHLGRPKNKEKHLRMNEVAKKILKLTGRKVEKIDDFDEIPHPAKASLLVLENLRFFEEETKNDDEFAKKLASLADIYVNDAFGVCHRAHASVHAITKHIPGCVGLLVEKELEAFDFLNNPKRPFSAVLGGSKLETKIPIIQNLLNKVDNLLLGGGMIFTFYDAKKLEVGKSIVDKNQRAMAKMLLNNEKLILPTDVIIADDANLPTSVLAVDVDKIPSYMIGLDIGKRSLNNYAKILSESKTVVWNGPLGYYETKDFARATVELLKFLASRTDIKVIIGGGDTASIVEDLGLINEFYHVSTGGGASLKLLEGNTLTAIEALKNNN
ncbi:MAG: phosphoglycerate kinase [Candidatus Woesearchaeota archaeon]